MSESPARGITKRQAFEKFKALPDWKRRELAQRHRGWAFQCPKPDDPWWNEDVTVSTPGYGAGAVEALLREAAR